MRHLWTVLFVVFASVASSSSADAQTRGAKDEEPVLFLRLEREVKTGRTPTVAAFSARGDLYISCAYDTAIEILDGKNFEQKARHRMSPLSPLGLIPMRGDKELVFANYAADTLHWLDLRKGEVTTELQLKFKPATLIVARDGRTAAVACDTEQEIMFVDLKSRSVRGEPVIVSGKPHGMVFDSRGSNLFVVCGDPTPTFARVQVSSHAVGFWDTPLMNGSPLVIAPGGKELYASRREGGILVLSPTAAFFDPAAGGAVLKEIDLDVKFHAMLMIDKKGWLAALDSLHDELWLFETKEWEVLQKIKTGKGPTCIAMGRDPSTLVVTNRSGGSISIYKVLQ